MPKSSFNWNAFLKPDLRKVIIFLVLFVGSTLLWGMVTGAVGWPLSFLTQSFLEVTRLDGAVGATPTTNFEVVGLLVDIIFWYLIAAAIANFVWKK